MHSSAPGLLRNGLLKSAIAEPMIRAPGAVAARGGRQPGRAGRDTPPTWTGYGGTGRRVAMGMTRQYVAGGLWVVLGPPPAGGTTHAARGGAGGLGAPGGEGAGPAPGPGAPRAAGPAGGVVR